MERDTRLSALANGFGSSGNRSPKIGEYTAKGPAKSGAGGVADYFFVTFLGSLAGSVFACSAESAFWPL